MPLLLRRCPTFGNAPLSTFSKSSRPAINNQCLKATISPLATRSFASTNVDMAPPVFFDISYMTKEMEKAGEQPKIGRVKFNLYDDVVPKTTKNFRELCKLGDKKGYRGSKFHRMIPHFMLQGGDFTRGNGTGGYSIYNDEGPFADENFKMSHSQPGMLSMANAGPNTNKSQFFITLIPTTWLDGKHVVFGEVDKTDGSMTVVRELESIASGSGASITKPEPTIVDCGELPE